MIRNYFKTAWRNLTKNRVFSFIHISGLALGMAVALLIGLWANYMYSWNRWVPGYQQAYQVKLNFNYNGNVLTQTGATLPLADALRGRVPGIRYVAESNWMGSHLLAAGEHKVYLNGGIFGADFFRIFPLPFVSGDPATALKDPYSIVVTETAAKALFGNGDALNKTVRFENEHDLRVTGILKDIPGNTSFQIEYVVPFSYSEQTNSGVRQSRQDWGNHSFPIYVGLQPNADFEQVAKQVRNLQQDQEKSTTARIEVMLHPFAKWRLYGIFENGKAVGGFIEYVRIYSIIGVLVLLIACINFTNLSTARSEKRAREVGVRKVVGSERKDLVIQFLAESLLVSFVAFALALLLAQLALPGFNALVHEKLQIPFSNPLFWGVMAGYVLFTGLLAGIRPAFYFSSFEPIRILKGSLQPGKRASWPRKALVIIQFACSFTLIVGTFIIYSQVQHAHSRAIGYDTNGLLSVDMNSDLSKNFEPLKNELLQSGVAEAVTKSSTSLDGWAASFAIKDWPGKKKDESLEMPATAVSEDYFRTVGMRMKEGREFMGDADTMKLILNEAAVKRLHLKDPLNALLKVDYTNPPMRVIGVVKDAIIGSPFQAAVPTMFIFNKGWAGNILLRLSPRASAQEGLARLRPMIAKYDAAFPFVYHFIDEEYANKFNSETESGQLIALFAMLAVVISCLGIFGLATYMAERRTKEIGIRKVMGASLWQLWRLLSTEFVLLVVGGCVVATPVALLLLRGWLQQFDYRVSITPGVFVLAAVLTLAITLITVSTQIIKAALINPVRSLRTE